MANPIKNVLIGGGTGGVGGYLIQHLIQSGYNVSIISRTAKARTSVHSLFGLVPEFARRSSKVDPRVGIRYHSWNDIKLYGLPYETDAVINLSGKTIGNQGFWNTRLKTKIRNSRIEPNNILTKAIQKAEYPPKVFLSASAVGIYENNADKIYTEDDVTCREGRENYFTRLCKDWESSTVLPSTVPTRVCNMRLGVVLADNLRPLSTLLPLCSLGRMGVMGSGTQPFPWIHISDITAIMELLIQNESLSGPINCVAPHIITNKEFTDSLVSVMHSKEGHALPARVLKYLFGDERAEAILLDSPKVHPHKLHDAGYQFKYKTITDAAEGVISMLNERTDKYGMFLQRNIAKNKKKMPVG